MENKRNEIIDLLTDKIYQKDFKFIIDYNNNLPETHLVVFNNEELLAYYVLIGLSYQELGDLKNADIFYDKYLDNLVLTDEIISDIKESNDKYKNIDKDGIKFMFLMNKISELGFTYKVDDKEYSEYLEKDKDKKVEENKGNSIIKLVSGIFFIISIISIFYDWRASIIIFSIGLIISNILKGPDFLLNMISGYLLILGVIFLFINLKIGVILFIIGVIIGYIRLKGNKSNNEYYGIMNELSNKYNLNINVNKPWLFNKGNSGNYNVSLNGKEYNVEVLEDGRFNW